MTAVEHIRLLLKNPIFLSTVFSLCTAQVLKLVFYLLTNKDRKKLDAVETVIWRTGGMPSSHSAIVCALVTSAGIYEGIESNFFVLCLVFAMVVLRDSLGIRRTAGLQAKALNNLGKQVAKFTGTEFRSIKEIHGHTPLEVLVGSCLGIVITFIFCLI